jgi:LmbE family N-acetylglucosaminyl deacetylase/SAM-dependent methyltransferase
VNPAPGPGATDPTPGPAFHSADQGTSERDWQRWGGLRALPRLDVDAWAAKGNAHLVLVAAHPDDETLGAAGLLAIAAKAGARVDVVVATTGDGSHPGSPTHSLESLARWRAEEVSQAVHHLAPGARVHRLGLPDGHLHEHRGELHRVLGALLTGSCWLVAPWRGDAHTDHDTAGAVAAEVASTHGAQLLEYPIWAWHWAAPGDDRLPWDAALALPLPAATRERKGEAMAVHRSQVEPLSPAPGDEVMLGEHVLAHFRRDVEVFFRTAAPLPARRTEGGGRGIQSLPAAFFEDFYARGGDDPWGFTDRWYERRKRALTLAALPRERFARALEPGCSIGVLTAQLGERCDDLLALDVVPATVRKARERTAHLPGVRVEHGSVPADWPEGVFDLVVLSEVGYYCGPADLRTLVDRAAGALPPDGVLVACHWRHPVPEYPLGGDAVHAALRAHPRLALLARHEEEDFLLDVLVPAPATSVARTTGLVP